MNFDEKDDDDFEKDFDEELEPEEKPVVKKPAKEVKSKTPAAKASPKGKKVSVFVVSTIGPGEKKQKLLIDTGNPVEAIKKTIGNIFGLDPDDFHLSSGGVTLDENSPVSNYDLSDGDEVLLIPSSTAGNY